MYVRQRNFRASGQRGVLRVYARQKNAPLLRAGRDFSLQRRLERKLSAELNDTPGEECIRLTEVGRREARRHGLDLRMVEGVKGFEAQFELAATSFIEHEVLEE